MSIHGVKWLWEPSDPNSGYRNAQMMGISEQFEFITPVEHVPGEIGRFIDHLYVADGSVDGQWNGLWGFLRVYRTGQPDLLRLPNNDDFPLLGGVIANGRDFNGACPVTAPVRTYDVTAVTADQALPGGTLIYNPHRGAFLGAEGPLHDPTAVLYVPSGDLDDQGKLKSGAAVEPLILRANAGDCLVVNLRNRLPENLPDLPGFNTMPFLVEDFNANQVRPSSHVALHPQLVAMDVSRSGGANVGFNPRVQTAAPGETVTYRWYAGDLTLTPERLLVARPIEFGAVNLISSDPIKHSNKGAVGALIIEPPGSTWMEDPGTRASATVTTSSERAFREFVLIFQDDINFRDALGEAVELTAQAEDPEDGGHKALNYRTEPMWFRLGFGPDTPLEQTRDFDFSDSLSHNKVGREPVTPIFTAGRGTEVRFRVLQPGGYPRNHVFQVHGHIWQRQPYWSNSRIIGDNPLSEWTGAQEGHGPMNHFDFIPLNGAGGAFRVPGDYLYRDQASFLFDGGLWGIFRVTP